MNIENIIGSAKFMAMVFAIKIIPFSFITGSIILFSNAKEPNYVLGGLYVLLALVTNKRDFIIIQINEKDSV